MNTKSALSALCLCLMAGSANAEIVNYTSSYLQSAFAGGNFFDPQQLNDSQQLVLADVTSYSNTLFASATDSFTYSDPFGNPVTVSTSASASSTLAMNADLNTGVFSASGSYGVGSPDWLVAGSAQRATFKFDLTSAYAYTLDMTASAGSSPFAFFSGTTSLEYFYSGYSNAAISVHQSGILGAGSVYITAYIQGRDQGGYYGFGGWGDLPAQPFGSFQYTLTLTPVPVPEPEAWGLMLSGLGLVGWAARRRKQAQV